MVISHDRQFLENLEPTHVITVRGGKVIMEERGLRDGDWNDPIDSQSEGESKFASKSDASTSTSSTTATASVAAPVKNEPTKKGKAKKGGDRDRGKKGVEVATGTASSVSNDDRKKKLNAPKRMIKIEETIAKHEVDMGEVDASLLEKGISRSTASELYVQKGDLQSKIDKLYAEYEELLLLVD
jgi:ATPase subunit of ABC transporter with duplicated ATPase domains